MTNAPTTANPAPQARAAAAEVTAIDAAARGPLLLLLGSGLVWLVISGVLALITSIQLHSPGFLAQHSFLTYGRAEAMRETAFIYGWAANAGLAIALWVLGRLGGNPLRATNWVFVGAVFWNIGLTAGLVGIAIGDLTSFSLFELPRYVQPLMVVAYGAIAISGILAWMGRRTESTFAAQWYAVAALFLFPWLSSLAQIVLLWSPVRGVAQAVASSWYAQGVWSLWLAPLALAGAYYLVAKLSDKSLNSYEMAPLGFWTLIVVGAWTGGRHLVGGPVPVWVATVAVVAAFVMLVHYLMVGVNLSVSWGIKGTSIALVRFGLFAYLAAGLLDTIFSFRGNALQTQFTFVDVAFQQLALYGGLSMMFFGAIYYMVPRLTGNVWANANLVVGHRFLVTLGVIVLVVALLFGGWTQGTDLLNPKTEFVDILEHLKVSLLAVSAAHLVLILANILLLVNFLQTISASVVSDVTALNPIRESTEASA